MYMVLCEYRHSFFYSNTYEWNSKFYDDYIQLHNKFLHCFPFHNPTSNVGDSPILGMVSLFYFSHSSMYMVESHCAFNLNFLMANGVHHLFMILLAIHIAFCIVLVPISAHICCGVYFAIEL